MKAICQQHTIETFCESLTFQNYFLISRPKAQADSVLIDPCGQQTNFALRFASDATTYTSRTVQWTHCADFQLRQVEMLKRILTSLTTRVTFPEAAFVAVSSISNELSCLLHGNWFARRLHIREEERIFTMLREGESYRIQYYFDIFLMLSLVGSLAVLLSHIPTRTICLLVVVHTGRVAWHCALAQQLVCPFQCDVHLFVRWLKLQLRNRSRI